MADPFRKNRFSRTLNMAGTSVMVGIPAGRDLPIQTVQSLLGTFAACQERGVPCQLGAIANSAVIQWARDGVIDLFMQSDASVLFWIDSDMAWEPGQFIRLLVWTQLYDVVCGAYPAKQEPPTFFVLKAGKPDEYGLIDINGIGLGFVAMRRSVVEALVAKAPKIRDEISGRDIASVFRVDSVNGYRRGEDMAFFADIREAGFSVKLDPSVDLRHIGQKVYSGSIQIGRAHV